MAKTFPVILIFAKLQEARTNIESENTYPIRLGYDVSLVRACIELQQIIEK